VEGRLPWMKKRRSFVDYLATASQRKQDLGRYLPRLLLRK
jgi:hypothetical protein